MVDCNALISDSALASFGVNLDTWTRGDQSMLREAMILVLKESPEMTLAEAEEACKEEIQDILFQKFIKQYRLILRQVDTLEDFDDAFDKYVDLGADAFDEYLETEIDFQSFASRFYSDLRTMWNADMSTLRDEFAKMKKNNWTMYQYKEYLQDMKRKARMS